MDLSSVFTLAAAGAGAVAAITALIGTFYTVPQKHVGLVTQFGRHVKTDETPGLKVKIPFIQKVEARVPTALQTVAVELDTKTKDDLFVQLPIKIQFEIDNPAKYYFDNDNPVQQVKDIISAETRKYTSGKEFQELYNEREEISEGVISAVKAQMDEYGISLRRIVIDEPKAPEDVQDAFNKVRASERLKDAAKNEADAEYIRSVRSAEAFKERDILRGEGAAGYRKKIFDQYAEQIEALSVKDVPREEAVRVMLEIMRMDTWREVGEKGNTFILTPSDADQGSSSKEISDLLKGSPVLEKLLNVANDTKQTVSAPKASGGPSPAP